MVRWVDDVRQIYSQNTAHGVIIMMPNSPASSNKQKHTKKTSTPDFRSRHFRRVPYVSDKVYYKSLSLYQQTYQLISMD